ncbi:MAG TPA: hypothetical protein VIL16_26760, partial [Trebonia sp.]
AGAGAAVGVAVTERYLTTVLVTAGVGAADRGAAVAEWLTVAGATSVTVPGVAHAASPSSAAASAAAA